MKNYVLLIAFAICLLNCGEDNDADHFGYTVPAFKLITDNGLLNLYEFPVAMEGDTIAQISVLDGFGEEEFYIQESVPANAFQIDLKSGYLTIKDPTDLILANHSNISATVEIRIGKKSIYISRTIPMKKLTDEIVISTEELQRYYLTLAYPFIKEGDEIVKLNASAMFGDLSYKLNLVTGNDALSIDVNAGIIKIRKPEFLNVTENRFIPFGVNINVTHPRTDKIWSRTIYSTLVVTNANELTCNSNESFLFEVNNPNEFYRIKPNNEGTVFSLNAGEMTSGEYTFVLDQDKKLCSVSTWSSSASDIDFELLNDQGQIMMRNTVYPKYIQIAADGEYMCEWGCYDDYDDFLKSQMPYHLEAGKMYTIRCKINSIDPSNFEAEYLSYAGLGWNEETWETEETISFPIQYGELSILSAKFHKGSNELNDIKGFPLIDLFFEN